MALSTQDIKLSEQNKFIVKFEKIRKAKIANHELCNKQFDLFYDLISAIISLFDIITDVWILIEWYYNDRMVFFTISLIILILANFCYLLVFSMRYGDSYKHNPLLLCCCTCIALPLAPLLSFTFYVVHNCSDDFLCLRFYRYRQHNGQSKSREWMENKLSKHTGFIMEAIMEAFPQSILQMIAIMYFNEMNVIAIISIIISMLSVSSKSLIICAASSINIKTMLFTWYYAITDFFALFFVLSFVFYSGDNINTHTIVILRSIWLYKNIIFTVPTCFFCSIPIFYWGADTLSYHMMVNVAVSSIFVVPLWCLGMMLGSMMFEILCYSYIAYFVYKLGHGRIPSTDAANTWRCIVDWIKYNGNDTLVRICCVNRELLLMNNNDNVLFKYLETKEHQTQYSDITYASLRKLYRNLIWNRFYNTFISNKPVIINALIVYYAISRVIHLFFPFIVIVVISMNGESIVYDLPLFQMVMLFVMIGMILIMGILFVVIYNEEQIIFYILPLRHKLLYSGVEALLYNLIESYYERLVVKPVIKQELCTVFGIDIGILIFGFIPFQIEEEEHAVELAQNAHKYTKEIKSTLPRTVQESLFRTYVIA